MGRPETSVPCVVPVALPATHVFGLWPKICRRGRTEAFLDPQVRKNLFYQVYIPRVQFQMAKTESVDHDIR